MRDPNRIPKVTEEIAGIWKNVPDWRFGQLMSNFWSWYGRDIFFLEDDKFIELFKTYAKENFQWYTEEETDG